MFISRALCCALVLTACNREHTHDTAHTHQTTNEVADHDEDGFRADRDCDDTNAAVHPEAIEVCDGLDNDCDGTVDGPTAAGALTFYLDGDGDGFGLDGATVTACAIPPGYAAQAGDCDDGMASVGPAAAEVCDGRDNDCDGATDEPGAAGALPWYADDDDDGWGDAAAVVLGCSQPDGYVATPGDCDDSAQTVHPGATEACNAVDEDCDQSIDEDVPTAPWWYLDADGDLFGNAAVVLPSCGQPQGYTDLDTDCDDLDPATYPGAPELCDGRVNTCGGALPIVEQDTDGDGWSTCAGDCDDSDAFAHPGMIEICDGADNDCDTAIDEPGAVGERAWYADTDSDGAGDPGGAVLACQPPAAHVGNDDDCDDGDGNVHPGATELCNGADDDCDGVVDDGLSWPDATDWYRDADDDGFGDDAFATEACAAPVGFVGIAGDCDDLDPGAFPGAIDVPGDGADDDCDGADPDLRVYVASATTGEIWSVDRHTGDPTLCTTLMDGNEPVAIVDITPAPAGHLFVASPEEVFELNADCIALGTPASGMSDITGLFYDQPADTLLISERTGQVWEVDLGPFLSRVLVAFLGAGPDLAHAVRRTGDPTLWLARGDDLLRHDPAEALDQFEVHHAHDAALLRLIPAPEGSIDALGADGWVVHPDNPHRLREPGPAWIESTVSLAPLGTTALCPDVFGPEGLLAVHDDSLTAVHVPSGTLTELNHVMTDVVGCATNALPDMDGDGFVAVALGGDDCDDADPSMHPRDGSPRDMVGNGVDEDCDGVDGIDADQDGYASLSTGGDDCDDADPALFPGAVGCAAAPGLACGDLQLQERLDETGVYELDYLGDGAYPVLCDMDGGWTLLGTNAHDGAWFGVCDRNAPDFPDGCTVMDDSAFGPPSVAASHKSPAFHEVPFTDVKFVREASSPLHYAVYEGVGDGTTSFFAFENAVPVFNCGTGTPYVWTMTEGTLGINQQIGQHVLCNENLYMHPWDWDSTACFETPAANNAYGPAWSGFEAAGGVCPPGLDDPEITSFRIPASGWGMSTPLSLYVR